MTGGEPRASDAPPIAREDLDEFLHERLGSLHADPSTYRIDHTMQVTSFGGSGTTALCNYLTGFGVDVQPGPGQWPFKHRRVPPAGNDVPAGFRVLYPLADPRDAVLSVFRRKLQVGHYRSLWGAEPEQDASARLADLDSFLRGGFDDFALADHVHRWRDHPPGYPVMFVRYDRFAEAWPRVGAFVGLADDVPPMALRSRGSDWRELEPVTRARLEAMYGELAAEIEALPATLVV